MRRGQGAVCEETGEAGEGEARKIEVTTISINDALGLYRDALVAVIPVMERAKIPWKGERVYDPWEDIERTLYNSIIGSCVENSPLLPLAPYGLTLPSYTGHSFLVSGNTLAAAFLDLRTGSAPFDEAVFLELGSNLVPTGKRTHRALAEIDFLIATPGPDRVLTVQKSVVYQP